MSSPFQIPQVTFPQVPSTDALSNAAKQSKENARIDKSAHDFEAVLLGNWLQSAEETFSKVPGGEAEDAEEQDGASSQFTSMAMQSLGNSFAANGGIGIARMISTQLHKAQRDSPEIPTSTEKQVASSSP